MSISKSFEKKIKCNCSNTFVVKNSCSAERMGTFFVLKTYCDSTSFKTYYQVKLRKGHSLIRMKLCKFVEFGRIIDTYFLCRRRFKFKGENYPSHLRGSDWFPFLIRRLEFYNFNLKFGFSDIENPKKRFNFQILQLIPIQT